MTFTYKQAEPFLHKWANHFVRCSEGTFEKWELIAEAWIRLQKQKVENIKFLSFRIKANMIDYIRTIHGRKCHKFKQGLPSQKWQLMQKYSAKFYPIQDYDYIEERTPFDVAEQEDFRRFVLVTGPLSARDKMVVHLRFFCDYTLEEISSYCGMSISWAAKRMEEVILPVLKDRLRKYYESQLT